MLLFNLIFFFTLFIFSGTDSDTPEIDVPSVVEVSALDVGNSGDGTDLEISFNKVSDESLISEYRVLVVNTRSQPDFNLAMAESVESQFYMKIEPNAKNKKITLEESSKDTQGNQITEGIGYKVFVLAMADGVNEIGPNSLSEPSTEIILKQLFFEVYVSDAAYFDKGGPYRIFRYNEEGKNAEVFINSNLDWPQDILFLEGKGEVLVSNFNSGRITKYDINSGDYLGNFASGLDAPTRMRIGKDNLLYVLQWSGDGKVARYELDGTFVDKFTNESVSQSIGIDWDTDGNLYISSFNMGANAEGFVHTFNGSGESQGLFIENDLQGPTNIWFDGNGDLLALDYTEGVLKRFDSNGKFLGVEISALQNPEGIAYFDDGRLLIGNGGNGGAGTVKLFDEEFNFIKDFVTSSTSGGLITPNAVVIRKVE